MAFAAPGSQPIAGTGRRRARHQRAVVSPRPGRCQTKITILQGRVTDHRSVAPAFGDVGANLSPNRCPNLGCGQHGVLRKFSLGNPQGFAIDAVSGFGEELGDKTKGWSVFAGQPFLQCICIYGSAVSGGESSCISSTVPPQKRFPQVHR